MAKTKRRASTRQYLTAERRRAQLLEAAAAVVSAEGWRGLTMTGVARAAGVSRQLVYEHFDDLGALSTAVLEHLLERLQTETMDVIASDELEPEEAIVAGAKLFLEAPQDHRRAMRALVGGLDGEASELEPTRRALRRGMIALWLPNLRKHSDVSDATARALVWASINAVWGIADLVDDGELTKRQALEITRTLLNPKKLRARAAKPTKSRRSTRRNR